MKICSIYKITNIVSGKSYIGFTNRNPKLRKAEHFSPSQYKSRRTKLYSAIKSYGKDAFIFDVIYCSLDEVHCLQMECYFIAMYDTLSNGYNLTTGGDKQTITPEVREKISKTKLGHLVSAETREKLASRNRRKWRIIYADGRETVITNLKAFCQNDKSVYNYLLKHRKQNKRNILRMEEAY